MKRRRKKRNDQQVLDRFRVYGYAVVYKRANDPPDAKWLVDCDEEYAALPAHYDMLEQAMDRVEFMREKGFLARVSTVLAEASDTVDTIGGSNK